MRIVIAGLGSAGRRHLSNVRAVLPSCEIGVWHTSGKEGVAQSGVSVLRTMEDALSFRPHAAIVSCPSPLHVPIARTLAAAGVSLLVEKPLSDSLDGVDDLISECGRTGAVLMVGYNFRFSEPLRALRTLIQEGRLGRIVAFRAEVGRYLPDWRPGTDYRCGVSARRSLGGGVVLELSHELDYARWLIGEVTGVSAFVARAGDLQIDVEDTAEILLEFERGAGGSVHLDMLQRASYRGCRVVGTDGTATWDASTNHARWYSSESGAWTDLQPPGAVDWNDMYKAELEHFFACVEGGATPEPDGRDARRTLALACAVKTAATQRRFISL